MVVRDLDPEVKNCSSGSRFWEHFLLFFSYNWGFGFLKSGNSILFFDVIPKTKFFLRIWNGGWFVLQISKINYVREAPSESRRFTTKICLSQYKLTVCFISSSAFWNFTKESPGVTICPPFYEYYCLCLRHFTYVSDGLTDCWIQCFAL